MSPVVPDASAQRQATEGSPAAKAHADQHATPMFVPITEAPQLPLTETLTERPEDANVRYEVATRHLLGAVPDDIEPYFDLFLYVSKAGTGPLAQRMFVFQRDTDGRIVPYAEWRVSTGREQWEIHNDRKVHTVTPDGIFMLDPNRFYRRYWSHNWDNAPMPYAMFYDLMTNGAHSGVAIHAAIGQSKIERLGSRDSAGCIRLAPRNAKELFYKVQNTTRGEVPVLAVNERLSTDRWGKAERNGAGAMMLQDGYRALLYVENFDGNQETVGPVVAYTH
jgi:L,D-transpeptidase catalytic domain